MIEADLTWTGAGFEPSVQIAIDAAGMIDAVGPLARAGATRLERIALLPGFVNTHSHAFQRGLRGHGERFPAGVGSFWTWREAMYSLVDSLDRATLRRLSAQAFAEMRDAGITSVGEFHYVHHERDGDFALDEAILQAATEVGIRLVLLYCYYATSAPGRTLDRAQRRFATTSVHEYWRQIDRLGPMLDPATQTMGAAPHSIRAANLEDIRAIYREARRRGLPVHLHVEEQRREIEECRAAYGRTPMAAILDALEDGAFTAVHCTHTTGEDMQRFLAAGGIACLCPLTEGNLGDGVPRLDALRAAGGRLAVGTDSNARLSVLEELRWLEYGQRLQGELRGAVTDPSGAVAPTLLAAATTGGARALDLRVGRIEPGYWADFAAVNLVAPALADVPAERLLEALVFGAGNEVIAGTYVGGRWRASAR